MASSAIALNNYLQGQRKLSLLTIEESSSGPPHAAKWTITYRYGQAIGTGSGPQKFRAKDAAAKEALKTLGVSSAKTSAIDIEE